MCMQFMQSPLVSGRVYTEQAQEAIEKFAAVVHPEGYVPLEKFVSIANLLISMIYKNSYPTQVCHSYPLAPCATHTRAFTRES